MTVHDQVNYYNHQPRIQMEEPVATSPSIPYSDDDDEPPPLPPKDQPYSPYANRSAVNVSNSAAPSMPSRPQPTNRSTLSLASVGSKKMSRTKSFFRFLRPRTDDNPPPTNDDSISLPWNFQVSQSTRLLTRSHPLSSTTFT